MLVNINFLYISKAAKLSFEELYDLIILYGYTCKLSHLSFVCGRSLESHKRL